MEMLRENFFRAYANLPFSVLDEIVTVVDDKPVTWRVAYFEVKNNTDKAEQILNGLAKIGIISYEQQLPKHP